MSNSNSKTWISDWLSSNYVAGLEHFFTSTSQVFHTQKNLLQQSPKSHLSKLIPFQRLDSVGGIESESQTTLLTSTYKKTSSILSTLLKESMPFLNSNLKTVVPVKVQPILASANKKSDFNYFQQCLSGFAPVDNTCSDSSASNLLPMEGTVDSKKRDIFVCTDCSVNQMQADAVNSKLLKPFTVTCNASCDSKEPFSRIASFPPEHLSAENKFENSFDCEQIDMQLPTTLPLDAKSNMTLNDEDMKAKNEITENTSVDTIFFSEESLPSICSTSCSSTDKIQPSLSFDLKIFEPSRTLSNVSDDDLHSGFKFDLENYDNLSEAGDCEDEHYKFFASDDTRNMCSNHTDQPLFFDHPDENDSLNASTLTVTDDTDSDNNSCQWERFCSTRTPWTCNRAKKKQNVVSLPYSNGSKTFDENQEVDIDVKSQASDLEIGDNSLPDAFSRPLCQNNAISFILGCSENGYESDNESDGSWFSDSEIQEDSDNSLQDDDDDTDQSAESSCALWNLFVKKQSHFLNSFSNTTSNLDSSNSHEKSSECTNFSSEPLQRNLPTKVRFNDDVSVHHMITWSFAYRQARKGQWETCARDHARFAARIASVEKDIAWCFEPRHREKVYASHFGSNAQ